MNRHYQRLRRFCALLIGIVFVLSGSFKLMDPVGTSLVTGEYLAFFHLNFLKWAAMPTAIVLALLETTLGIALMSGVFRRVTAIACFTLCTFFTLLTAILAIFNPTMDCGCFGDVIPLTHIQSLVKNLVLLALCCLAFIPFRDYGIPRRIKWVSSSLALISSLALLVYSLLALPFKDYTSLRPGTRLTASLEESESAVFQAVYIYGKDGVEQAFTLDDELPDSTWTFLRSETAAPHEESVPLSIRVPSESDFSGAGGGYGNAAVYADSLVSVYADSLAATGNVLIISTYRGSEQLKPAAKALLEDFAAAGGTSLHLCLRQPADEFSYMGDRRSILALNRSNGGATFIQDGIVIRKWSSNFLPSADELQTLSEAEALGNLSDVESRSDLLQQSYLLWIFTLLLLL